LTGPEPGRTLGQGVPDSLTLQGLSPGPPVVEYGLILAHNAAGFFSQDLPSLVSRIPWQSVAYGILGLILLRVAIGALRPHH
jgi:hypothetical protein